MTPRINKNPQEVKPVGFVVTVSNGNLGEEKPEEELMGEGYFVK